MTIASAITLALELISLLNRSTQVFSPSAVRAATTIEGVNVLESIRDELEGVRLELGRIRAVYSAAVIQATGEGVAS